MNLKMYRKGPYSPIPTPDSYNRPFPHVVLFGIRAREAMSVFETIHDIPLSEVHRLVAKHADKSFRSLTH
jgi:hypothetical protein